MSDNWIVQNLENALETWNDKLSEIWALITMTPQSFRGGKIWNVIVDINGAVQSIGLALLVLFFVAGVVKNCGSFTDVKKPEHAMKLFVRFALAKGAITYGMELMLSLFDIAQGAISTIMSTAGFSEAKKTVLPTEMVTAIENCSFFVAVFIPFRVQDVQHTNGIYYGQNVISKNMIVADRRQLLNGNEFILGVSGGGKSFTAKGEILNQVLVGDADVIIIDPEREYAPLVRALGGEIINISATSPTHINAMDMTREYGDGANPVILKSEFIMSLCEQLIGGSNLGAVQKSIIDRCTAAVYRNYQQNDYTGAVPTLQDFRAELIKQPELEAQEIALSIELFTNGSLNTFAKRTNVDTDNRLICYDILDLGKQLMPIGMLVVLDSILNRITANRAKGKNTFIFIDEIYLLFQHEYSANFLFTLWKRVRKYGAYATGITQNVDDLLQSHTARTMLANSEFIIMLNQAPTDRIELAKLLNISDNQLSYITNVGAGHGLIKVGSSLIPFANKFPKSTKLYKLMTTKPGEGV